MRRDLVIRVFKDVLNKAGWSEFVSLSETPNELADIMVYQEPFQAEYLACNGNPLFEFGQIRNILYAYGPDAKTKYHHEGSKVQFVIELNWDALYVLEYGDEGPYDFMRLDGEWESEFNNVQVKLSQYNQRFMKRDNVECLLYAAIHMVQENDPIDDPELTEIKQEIERYINANPDDQEFLLDAAYISLMAAVEEDTDLFNIKDLIKKIVSSGFEDSFIGYIKRANICDNDFSSSLTISYVSLGTAALRLIREAKEELSQ